MVAEPRPSAAVILVRGDAARLELLLARRNPLARFMGGAWVFPGGAVDADEDHRATALRELREEVAIELPADAELVPFARWITPRQLGIRFDAHFFLARAPAAAEPRADGDEVVAVAWWEPAAALVAEGLELAFPTRKQLEQLAGFASAEAALEWARGHTVTPVEPELHWTGEQARIVLPGDGA